MEKRMELLPGVTLTAVQTEKFKTGCFSINFFRPLRREEAAMNALIPSVLLRGSEGCPDLRAIAARLDELYGASAGTLIRKKGEVQMTGFYADFIEDALAGEPVFAPMMDFLGELEDVEQITPEGLYAQYRKVLAESRVELFYMGRKSAEDVAEQLRRVLRELPRAAAFDAVGTEKQRAGGDVQRVEERMDVTQGKLSMGFTTGCTAGEAEYPALLVLNTAFGGGITSKLFTKVREELSLCYYAMSSIEKNKGVMIVSSGVEFDKLETAEKEILRQLEDCRNGEISDYEFDSAKRYLLSDLKTALDSPGRLDDYAIGQRAAGLEGGMEKLARGIEAVTRGQVAEAARRVTLDTIFTLRGTEE